MEFQKMVLISLLVLVMSAAGVSAEIDLTSYTIQGYHFTNGSLEDIIGQADAEWQSTPGTATTDANGLSNRAIEITTTDGGGPGKGANVSFKVIDNSDFAISFFFRTTGGNEYTVFAISESLTEATSVIGLGQNRFCTAAMEWGTYEGSWSCTETGVSDNTWHHLVVNYYAGNSSVYLYIDGVMERTRSMDIDYYNHYFMIGQYYAGAQSMGGDIDELVILNKSLTYEEIEFLNNSYDSWDPDTTSPTITNQASSADEVIYTFSAESDENGACTLYGDWTGSWLKNETKTVNANVGFSFTAIEFLPGDYNWGINCSDESGNVAWGTNNSFNPDYDGLWTIEDGVAKLKPEFGNDVDVDDELGILGSIVFYIGEVVSVTLESLTEGWLKLTGSFYITEDLNVTGTATLDGIGIWKYESTQSTTTCNQHCADSDSTEGFNAESGSCLDAWDIITGSPIACSTNMDITKKCLCSGTE